MLQLIRDLASTCKPLKLGKVQRTRAADLMRQLRGYGFTNPELHVLAKRRISEPTIKRWTRGVTVENSSEHDRVIAMLGDFAFGGNTLKDLDEYKSARETLSGYLSFEACVKLATNLMAIGTDINGLLKLGEDLADKHLQVPAIQENMILNEELRNSELTPEIQVKLLGATKRYGDPEKVLQALMKFESIQDIDDYKKKLEEYIAILEREEADSKRKKEGYDNESLKQKTYLDIVKLLVSDYSYDYDSLRTLHELAGKFGDPLRVMGAVNAYAGIEEMKTSASTAETKLKTIEAQVASADARFQRLNELNMAADRKLGEIKANYESSFRLQQISELLTHPRRLQTTPKELASLIVAFLLGVVENNQAYPGGVKFDGIVRSNVQATIMNLQKYAVDNHV